MLVIVFFCCFVSFGLFHLFFFSSFFFFIVFFFLKAFFFLVGGGWVGVRIPMVSILFDDGMQNVDGMPNSE